MIGRRPLERSTVLVGAIMQIELSRDDVELLRDTLQREVRELDKEINRTDSLGFKRKLQETDRRIERILGRITAALEHADE
jgi:glycine cleavage system regulatory protein